jgi:NAD(P) transhydrogenase
MPSHPESKERSTGPSQSFDLVVIGSGPAGYRAAMQAAKLRKTVAIIEKTRGRLGGAWIHTGTIPSKTLRESMDSIHNIRFHAGPKWVERIIRDLPAEQLMGQALKVAQYEEQIVRRYFARYNIQLIEGMGVIEDEHTVRVVADDGTTSLVEGSFILLSTGSRPRRPPEVPFDGWRIVDADELLRLESVPKSIIIFGAGVIGCEYACIFRALGVETTIIDSRATLMQYADQEIAHALKKSMEQRGIRFVLGAKLRDLKVSGPRTTLFLDSTDVPQLEAEVVFYATGRRPNTERIGLERVGVKVNEKGEILVNENFQTAVRSIYAAGDNIGMPALAATAAAQGRHAACHMFGTKNKPFPKAYPIGIYTIPELSSVGLAEHDLIAQGRPYVVGRAHYSEVARGYIRGDDHGLLKLLICKETHRILGIHILGHDACNLIHIGLAFMQKNGFAQDLLDMIFNYPTLAEAFRIAAFNGLNKLFPDGEIGDPPQHHEEMPKPPPTGPKGEQGSQDLKIAPISDKDSQSIGENSGVKADTSSPEPFGIKTLRMK